MLTNNQMVAGRFLRWAKARKLGNKIIETLEADGEVAICTMTRVTMLKQKHLGMVKVARNGVFLQRGKSWSCVDYCGFKFYNRVKG